MSDREAFLSGERPDAVAIFLSESFVNDPEALLDHGERVDGGVLLVVDGERGRRAFRAATGSDAMSFASEARGREGHVARDLTAGDCPAADGTDADGTDADGGEHDLLFLFAFAEEQHEDLDGIYAEGDVIHAYARCSCGTSYADRWTVEE